MGGHGGLNILPQKRWNVYNYENREKVRKDEEAAAREEQLKREQSRQRDSEFRLERLREARNLPNPGPKPSDSGHINLFNGLADFDSKSELKAKEFQDKTENPKKRRREEPPVVGPEDEKYKLGYGLVGKGVKTPWYLSGVSLFSTGSDDETRGSSGGLEGSRKKTEAKKTIEELREERMRRERQEKERESKLLASAGKKNESRGFSRRR